MWQPNHQRGQNQRGQRGQNSQVLFNRVSLRSLTGNKTCVLSIIRPLARWEHILIDFQHISNRELESRNKSKLLSILLDMRLFAVRLYCKCILQTLNRSECNAIDIDHMLLLLLHCQWLSICCNCYCCSQYEHWTLIQIAFCSSRKGHLQFVFCCCRKWILINFEMSNGIDFWFMVIVIFICIAWILPAIDPWSLELHSKHSNGSKSRGVHLRKKTITFQQITFA